MPPESIPVEALDQLNLASTYIDPKTYELMPMDSGNIKNLYERVANTKLRNPNLKVWMSVGGWSFNDPGAYRSIFGAIAGDERLSAKFAQNCVDFMNQYGFDGVDIDWEYPGTEERGGTLSDMTNFPRMLGILQARFKAGDVSGNRFGLSITVPTAYRYVSFERVSQRRHRLPWKLARVHCISRLTCTGIFAGSIYQKLRNKSTSSTS
jgi:chitinase